MESSTDLLKLAVWAISENGQFGRVYIYYSKVTNDFYIVYTEQDLQKSEILILIIIQGMIYINTGVIDKLKLLQIIELFYLHKKNVFDIFNTQNLKT